MPKKICFVIGNYNNGGGTERVTSQIASGLVEKEYEVSIVSLGKGLVPYFQTDDRIKLYEIDALQSSPFENKKARGFSRLMQQCFFRVWCMYRNSVICRKLKRSLKQIKADVVIAVDISCYRYIDRYRKALKFKTIGWEHFCLIARNGIGVNYSRYLATKHAARVIVLGNKDLEDYKNKYPKATNLQRIYNPIAFDLTNQTDMRNKVVIAAGRYTYQKGFDLLIEAWNKIADQISDWELRIFGEGEDRQKLETQIQSYNLSNIKLCGYANDLSKEMNQASIFAFSSRYEGWGLVLIEAQAKGLPCVSFACKQGPEEIIDDGVNGYLVPPNDIDNFANKLLSLMKNIDLRKSFSEKSQKDLNRFAIDIVINEWMNMLNSI